MMIGENIIVFDLEIQRAINTSKTFNDKSKCTVKGFEGYYQENPDELKLLMTQGFNDLEVAGWNNVNKTRISYGVVYDYKDDRWLIFDEQNVDKLFERINSADKVVGFNHINFDYTVLSGYGQIQPSALRDYDMMQMVQNKVGKVKGTGLDAIALATVGIGKTDDGADAPGMWQRGEHARLITYCIDDVVATKKLYEHIVTNKNAIVNGKTITF